MNACFCSGPQRGEPLCPCRMRDLAALPLLGAIQFAPRPCPPTPAPTTVTAAGTSTVPMGWLCPKCNESNGPHVPTCFHCAMKQGASS